MFADLVIITWNGTEEAFKCVEFDTVPKFDIMLFNYSGNDNKLSADVFQPRYLVSVKTENKGQIFDEIYKFLSGIDNNKYRYIGIIDDDIIFRVADFNYMLKIAAIEELDVFQPSVSHDSYFSHRNFVNVPGRVLSKTGWVEIMAPFYRQELFDACQPYFFRTISGQGIDCFLMPCIQKLHNKTNTAIIHAVTIKHYRPIRSHKRIYSNGLNNEQEIEAIRLESLLLANSHPEIFDFRFKALVLKKGNLVVINMMLFARKMEMLVKMLVESAKNLANR